LISNQDDTTSTTIRKDNQIYCGNIGTDSRVPGSDDATLLLLSYALGRRPRTADCSFQTRASRRRLAVAGSGTGENVMLSMNVLLVNEPPDE
jgi:hypothetical protein